LSEGVGQNFRKERKYELLIMREPIWRMFLFERKGLSGWANFCSGTILPYSYTGKAHDNSVDQNIDSILTEYTEQKKTCSNRYEKI
jgi:hypothetical protein